jgi:hypothetical protein
MSPIVQGAATRIRAAIPDAKLIYLVRDPIERTFAHYRQRVAAEGERRPPREAIGDLHDRRNPYVCPSRYATQLREYLSLFPSEQVVVVDQADLQADRRMVLRRLFEFLGVDPGFESPAFARQHNVAAGKRANSRLYVRLHRALKEPILERLPPRARRGVAALARPALTRPLPGLSLGEDIRFELCELFATEVADLRAITGLEFRSWSL